MSRAQAALVLHALTLIGAMALIVPALADLLGAQLGYLASLAVYWLAFCVPVMLWHVRGQRAPGLFSERLAWRDWFVPVLLLAQVLVLGLVVLMRNSADLTTHGAMLAAAIALVNAPLEEVAWRGGFITRFADRPRLGFWLGWLLFSAWPLSLTLNHGIAHDGGTMALVAVAGVLGLLWSWIAWRTGSIFWVSIAHVLSNILTFWVLFDGNGFVPGHYQP